MIDCQKHLFDIPDDVTYLNAAYMAPILKSSAQVGKVAVAQKLHPWEITIDDFFGLPKTACGLFASLIDSAEDCIAIVPSASYGVGTATKNCKLEKGQKIIVLADQFPSHVYPWQEVARDKDAIIETIPWPADDDWTAALLNAIDQTTAVVACPQAHWTNGTSVDLVAVGKKCRAVGAALVLDLTQSLGVMPFSVKDVDPDFMIAGSYKWLLGPYSYGYMYVAPRHHNGIPLEENWIARKDSEDFSRLVDYKDPYQPGAGRFHMGEKSNFINAPIAIDALKKFNELGVDNISAYLKTLTNYVAEKSDEIGLNVARDKFRAPHLIGINFKDGVPSHIAPMLASNKVFVSVRGQSIRVATHIYNDKADIDRLFTLLQNEI